MRAEVGTVVVGATVVVLWRTVVLVVGALVVGVVFADVVAVVVEVAGGGFVVVVAGALVVVRTVVDVVATEPSVNWAGDVWNPSTPARPTMVPARTIGVRLMRVTTLRWMEVGAFFFLERERFVVDTSARHAEGQGVRDDVVGEPARAADVDVALGETGQERAHRARVEGDLVA